MLYVSNPISCSGMDPRTQRVLVLAEVWLILNRIRDAGLTIEDLFAHQTTMSMEEKFNQVFAEAEKPEAKLATADDFRRYAQERAQHYHKTVFQQVLKECRKAVKANPSATSYRVDGSLHDQVIALFQQAGFTVSELDATVSIPYPQTVISWE